MNFDPYADLVIPLEDEPAGNPVTDVTADSDDGGDPWRNPVTDVTADSDDGGDAWPTIPTPGSVAGRAAADVARSADALDGVAVLDDAERFLSRFVAYPGTHERVAHVLWIAHAWLMDAWESTPRLAFLSPEPGSGKSRALEVTEPLVPRPMHAVNVTPAYLFRKVADPEGAPTILYDEIDTVFGAKAKGDEDVRGMLNAGHRKGAVAGRCVIRGKSVETEELEAYCAVALAGLDDLPDTIMTRAIVVRMRRRKPGERVQPWRLRIVAPEAEALAERIAEWCASVADTARNTWPEMPDGVEDRNADVWEALVSVGDLAGGSWPERARAAAVALVAASAVRPPSIGVLLLRDVRTVFGEMGTDKLATATLLDGLHALDESPWSDLHGKELDARGLAYRLGKYGVKPGAQRAGGGVFKGYNAADLADAWSRYLPPGVTDVTDVTEESSRGSGEDAEARPSSQIAVTPVTRLQTCRVCHEPIDAAAGDVHPLCGEVAS